MEKSWKVVEHIRDRNQAGAFEAAQALANAVLAERPVVLATDILRGDPFAVRRALELAELIIDSDAKSRAGGGVVSSPNANGGRGHAIHGDVVREAVRKMTAGGGGP
jgi:hypothetical protein